jgi:hypothetical protein
MIFVETISKEDQEKIDKLERKKVRKDREVLLEELVPKPSGR